LAGDFGKHVNVAGDGMGGGAGGCIEFVGVELGGIGDGPDVAL